MCFCGFFGDGCDALFSFSMQWEIGGWRLLNLVLSARAAGAAPLRRGGRETTDEGGRGVGEHRPDGEVQIDGAFYGGGG